MKVNQQGETHHNHVYMLYPYPLSFVPPFLSLMIPSRMYDAIRLIFWNWMYRQRGL